MLKRLRIPVALILACLLGVGTIAFSMEPCACCPPPTTVPDSACHSAPPPDACCSGAPCCDLAPVQSPHYDTLVFTAGYHLFETLAAGAYLPADKDTIAKEPKGRPPGLRLPFKSNSIPIYLQTLTLLC